MTVLGHFELSVSVLVGAAEVFQISICRDTVLNPLSGNLWSLVLPRCFQVTKVFHGSSCSPLPGSRAAYIRKCGRATAFGAGAGESG